MASFQKKPFSPFPFLLRSPSYGGQAVKIRVHPWPRFSKFASIRGCLTPQSAFLPLFRPCLYALVGTLTRPRKRIAPVLRSRIKKRKGWSARNSTEVFGWT
jgi:hypothetical protein